VLDHLVHSVVDDVDGVVFWVRVTYIITIIRVVGVAVVNVEVVVGMHSAHTRTGLTLRHDHTFRVLADF